MRRILINDEKIDVNNYAFFLPWRHDSICYNFRQPKECITISEIKDIDALDIETLVIGCDLDDFNFISGMNNLKQLYIYFGKNLHDDIFLSNLVKLQHLCILNSNIKSLNTLSELMRTKKKLFDTLPTMEYFDICLDGILVMSDYDELNTDIFDGNELYVSEIHINDFHKY